MLLLNLAWNDRFVKVSKCNASKIIFNQIIQLFPVVIPVWGLLDVLYHFVGHVTPGVI